MNPLCFNTMNRSAYILGDTDPDLPGQIRAAARAGFSLFGADSYSLSRFCREGGRVEEIAAQLDSAGLESFELPTLAINGDRSTSRAQTDQLVDMARVLRPSFVQLNLDSTVDEAVLEDLRRAGSAFGDLGVRLAIEYLPWLPEVKDILSTRALLERAEIPGAGVLVDTWHFTHSGDRWEDLEALPLEELAYVQFDDHPPLVGKDLIHETLMRRAMPGEGEFELERFCRVFKEKGYEGPVSCEILSAQTRESEDLDSFAQRVFETSAPYWSD